MPDAGNNETGKTNRATQPDWSATHVVMGRIGAPHGIKGWVKLISFTDPLVNLLEYDYFWVAEGNALRKIEIDEARPQGQTLVGHIKGCDVREETRQYTGLELMLPKSELPVLDEGYYWHQLEGLRVVNLAGEDLGVVDHLLATGANDVLIVRGDAASVDQEERLVPYVSGQVVKEVDLTARVVRVDWGKDY
ncbi:MAG: rRNA processing protein RimM [Pseudomonadota bacterium]|jgi:16S rRNA processing protein RimM